jgi:hypothetical protein
MARWVFHGAPTGGRGGAYVHRGGAPLKLAVVGERGASGLNSSGILSYGGGIMKRTNWGSYRMVGRSESSTRR